MYGLPQFATIMSKTAEGFFMWLKIEEAWNVTSLKSGMRKTQRQFKRLSAACSLIKSLYQITCTSCLRQSLVEDTVWPQKIIAYLTIVALAFILHFLFQFPQRISHNLYELFVVQFPCHSRTRYLKPICAERQNCHHLYGHDQSLPWLAGCPVSLNGILMSRAGGQIRALK